MEETKHNRVTGLVFVAIGVAFGLGSVALDMGTWQDLGPGRWPLICSLSLTAVGLILALRR